MLELVPRNASRVPADLAGNIGTSALRWAQAYVQEYFVGDAANQVKIVESSPGVLTLSIGGSDICSFSTTLMSAPDLYIPYDTLRTRQAKIAVDYNQGSAPGASPLIQVASATVNGCLSGKTLLIDYTLFGYSSTAGAGTIDYIVYINGAAFFSQIDQFPTGGSPAQSPHASRRLLKYTIPANGNYTVSISLQQAAYYDIGLRVEEV